MGILFKGRNFFLDEVKKIFRGRGKYYLEEGKNII